jgi:hypothetical protein
MGAMPVGTKFANAASDGSENTIIGPSLCAFSEQDWVKLQKNFIFWQTFWP